jgi:hypothetical protein
MVASKKTHDCIGAWHQKDDLSLQNELAACRVTLSELAFAEAIEQGRAMTKDRAIAFALESSINS